MGTPSRRLDLGEEEHMWLARAFRKIDFFKGMTLGQLELILPNIERHAFADRAAVIEIGDQPRGVYLVYRGEAAVKRKTWLFGRPREVARLGTGEVFGEMAVLDQRRHAGRVEAAGPLEVFLIHLKHFRYVLERNPGLIDHFKAVVADRILDAERVLEGRRA